ncbi:putative low-density lipoprotein receptor class A domain-containing protein 4, partial [Triplophysa rosa]
TECKFRCTNGRCLKLLSLICNHLNECGDNSDEEHCPAAVPPPPDTIQSRVCLSGAAPLSEEGGRDARRWGVSLRQSRKAILLNDCETKRPSGCGERIYHRLTAANASDDGMKRERTERPTPTAAVNVSVSSCEGRGRRLSRPRPVTFPEPPCETSRSRTAAPETTTPTPMTHAPATAPYPSHREWIYFVGFRVCGVRDGPCRQWNALALTFYCRAGRIRAAFVIQRGLETEGTSDTADTHKHSHTFQDPTGKLANTLSIVLASALAHLTLLH